jgi:hypothetical protein
MKVHLCALTTLANDSVIHFATMLMTLPIRLPNVHVNVDFNSDAEASYAKFLAKDDELFVHVPTHASCSDFLSALCVGEDAWAPIAVCPNYETNLHWDDSGLTVKKTIETNESTAEAFETAVVRERPLVFAIRRGPGMPLTIRNAFPCVARVDAKNVATVTAKHLFKGCVGYRTVLR